MTDDAVAWLRANAHEIKTVDPEAPSDDLRFLLDIIGDARIVGLGEATHGTREFSLLKHRIVKLLVEEAGFRVVVFERDVPLVANVDAYVCGDGSSIEDAMTAHNVYPWHTEELRELLEWMRARNVEHGEGLRFVGCDMQAPAQAMAFAAARLGDGWATEMEALNEQITTARAGRDDDAVRAWAGVEGAVGAFVEKVKAHDAWAALSLRTVGQSAPWDSLNVRTADQVAGGGDIETLLRTRDRGMADNIAMIADEILSGERIIVWAHNGHVGRIPRMMGEHLNDRYGDDYRTVGFSFFSGSYAAATFDPGTEKMDRRLVPFEAEPARDGAVEHLFHEADLPMFGIELREPHPAFQEPREARMIGFVGGFEEWEGAAQADAYDAVVHVDATTAAIPVPWSDGEWARLQS